MIIEQGDDEDLRVTISPVRCERCGVTYRVDSDELTIVEPPVAR